MNKAGKMVVGVLVILGLLFLLALMKSSSENQVYIEKRAVETRAILDRFLAGESIPVSQVWFANEHGFVEQRSINWMEDALTKCTNVTITVEELEALRNTVTTLTIHKGLPPRK